MSVIELAKDFRKENIFVWNEGILVSHAFGYLFDSLVCKNITFDPMLAWNDMQKRIAEGVYMGNGLFIPHVRVKGLENPLLSLGICAQGFLDVKNTHEKGHVITMIMSPLDSPLAHTKIIGKIARLILDKNFTEKLMSCKDRDAVYAFLTA